MNIFIFDNDPIQAASYMCDKHIIKMPLETAQMMCTAINLAGVQMQYKTSYLNHPCTIWTRENTSNFEWLYKHGIAICKEYTSRYSKIHKSQQVIEECFKHVHLLKKDELTDFAQAMPDKYKSNDAVSSYRNYFLGEKQHLFQWKNGNIPYWVKQNLNQG